MVNRCGICDRAVTPSTPSLRCSKCQKFIHIRCTSLSPSETSFVNNNASNWMCDKCSHDDDLLPEEIFTNDINPSALSQRLLNEELLSFQSNLMSEINGTITKLINEHLLKLTERVASLEMEVTSLRNLVKNNNSSPNRLPPSNIESIVSEVSERNKRSSNLIIIGVEEGNFNNATDQMNHDKQAITEILAKLSVKLDDNETIVPIRLGKSNNSQSRRNRPIKIRLSSEDAVLNILRRSPELKKVETLRKIVVCKDRTPLELQHIKMVKRELMDRQAKGELNLSIKYFRNVPRIVQNTISSAATTSGN